MKTEPSYSRALPEAMGYTVKDDMHAGYGIVRMLIRKPDSCLDLHEVWNPRDDSAQCFEVLCWLMSLRDLHFYDGEYRESWFELSGRWIYKMVFSGGDHVAVWSISAGDTPATLRAAIVEAAERVADAKGDK